MYLLRRTAVRALSQQSNVLSRTYQPAATRVISLSQAASKPIAWRGFHQARVWRAEEDKKGELAQAGEESPAESESAQETVQVEPEEQEDVVEESVEMPDSDVGEKSATSTVADAASSVANAASSAASSAAQTLDNATAPQGRRPSRPHDATSTHRNPRPSRICYIGNLFFEVTAEQLEREFARYGKTTNSRIVTDSRGLSKGFGYVEMETQDGADLAVRELDQKVFEGRRMAVQYHVRREDKIRSGDRSSDRPTPPPSKTLFIGNMSYQMSDRDLNDLFREIRDVLDVRVAIDRRSGQPRGFAHADFVDISAAERAKEHLENKVVYGRQLRVDFSVATTARPRRED